MCDLDRFKLINDTHGHAIGDEVIKTFSEIATGALWPNDLVGRIGGEEFAMVLPRASVEMAQARAERIRVDFAEACCFVDGHRVNATVSCGLSVSANAEETLSELLRHADLALYRAKAEEQIACAQTILDGTAAKQTLSALPKEIETVRWC